MIQSVSDRDTEELFVKQQNRRFSNISRVALRKLIQVNQASRLTDLVVPPGNHLEKLWRELAGFHSIRINDQWRIIFEWTDAGPARVAIRDYHEGHRRTALSGQTQYVLAYDAR